MTSQATSSDQQWADEREADGAATPMPERRPVGIRFMSSSGGWQLCLANTYLGYYSTAIAAYDAWCLNCAQVAVEEVEADAVSAYQRAAAAVVTAIAGVALA